MSDAASRLRQRAAEHASKCADDASMRYPAAMNRVRSVLETLKEQRSSFAETINGKMDSIVAEVEAHRVRVLGRLDSMYKERVKSLEATLDRLIVSAGQLEACLAAVAKHSASAAIDIAKAAELESLCAGMSALADAYVGVDVPPCMGVSVASDGLVGLLDGIVQLKSLAVCSENCVLQGNGLDGFKFGSSEDAHKVNTFTVTCVGANGSVLKWVCADDVQVDVRLVNGAIAGDVDVRVPCTVTTIDGNSGGVLEVRYEVPGPPITSTPATADSDSDNDTTTTSDDSSPRWELEVSVRVCRVSVVEPYEDIVEADTFTALCVPEYRVFAEKYVSEAAALLRRYYRGQRSYQWGAGCELTASEAEGMLLKLCDVAAVGLADLSFRSALDVCVALSESCPAKIEVLLDANVLERVLFPLMDAHARSNEVQESACYVLNDMLGDAARMHRRGLYDRALAAFVSGNGQERLQRIHSEHSFLDTPGRLLWSLGMSRQ